jgi:Domain of unknown function (DUF1824)
MMTISAAETVLEALRDTGVPVLRDRPEIPDTAERDRLRQALQVLQEATDYQMFGVCAESRASGLQGLQSYAQHFGSEIPAQMIADLPVIAGSVYLKFNPRSQRLYIDVYEGSYRGVLISFQSDLANGYSGTHGHFPLDLFA